MAKLMELSEYHPWPITYLPTLKPYKIGSNERKSLKIGIFLNFLYITTDRFFAKIGTHGKNIPANPET